MNVKISETSVTFKISEEELNSLLSGIALKKTIPIGQNHFTMIIDPDCNVPFEDIAPPSLNLIFNLEQNALKLCTTMAEIKKLSDMGRNRDGLSANNGTLDIFLQVDVRKDSRRKTERDEDKR